MTPHVIESDLTHLRARTLTPAATLALIRHLESCSECAAMAAAATDPQDATEAWSSSLQGSLGDHLRGDELSDYVDCRLPRAAMRSANGHLEQCSLCRGDVADLRRLSRRRFSWRKVSLIAAALVVGFI